MRGMNKLRLTAAVLSIIMLAAGLVSCGESGKGTAEYNTRLPLSTFCYDTDGSSEQSPVDNSASLSSFTLFRQTDWLALYADESTGNVAVEDKRSGKLWTAVPLDLNTDTKATADMQEIMRSTVKVDYYVNNVSKTMYGYADCVEREGLTVSEIENGVRMEFHIQSDDVSFTDLPSKLSDKRFQQFFVNHEALTATDKKRITRYFTQGEGGIWVRGEETDTMLRALSDITRRVGYTDADLKQDNEENGIPYTPSRRIYFTIPVDYILQNDSLIVDIPLAEMEYNKEYPPVYLYINELLLQSRGEKDGYLFVPDGSGALVDFSSGETDTGSHSMQLYGNDKVISNHESDLKEIKTVMPVYGISSGDGSALAILEDGDALARITAQKAGTLNSYNSVSAGYRLVASSFAAIGDGSIMSQVPVYQRAIYQGSLRTRYVLFNKTATYAQMADCYRKYIMEQQKLTNKGLEDNAELFLELTGAIRKTESALGFQYEGSEKLTTYKQAAEILDLFEKEGINKVYLKYTGVLKGGLEN